MAVSDRKTRLMITVDKEDRAVLEKIALEQNRNLSNLVATIIKEYINKESNKN